MFKTRKSLLTARLALKQTIKHYRRLCYMKLFVVSLETPPYIVSAFVYFQRHLSFLVALVLKLTISVKLAEVQVEIAVFNRLCGLNIL